MPVTEIIAVVTGVVGCVTAIVTPCVRGVIAEYSSYLRIHEEYSSYLYEEEHILRNIFQILGSSRSQVDHQSQLMRDAQETLEMINYCRNVEPWDFFGMCSCLADYRRSYLVGKYISQVKKRVKKLRDEFQNRGINVGVENEEEQGEFVRMRRGFVGQHGNKAIQEIMSMIVYNNTPYIRSVIIGVYGACGVGKTETVAHVCNRILQDNRRRFITFVWVEVSSEDDILKLQTKIANKIDPKLPISGSVRDNAIVLKKALMKKKNVLLVLDNMRKAFSLEEIGLPAIFNSNISIIITSRSLSVCTQMKCYRGIPLRSLSNDEAYELLINEIGITGTLLTEEIQSNLKKIAKECGGLPLAVVAVAKYLRKHQGYGFFSAKRCLKRESAAFSNLKYLEDEVYQDLMLSYEQLKHSRYSCAEECLLYCTMYPRNHAFSAAELMKYWMGEGLLSEEGIEEMMGESREVLEELKDASLLETVAYENGELILKMHPIVWDLLEKIEKENPRFSAKCERRLEKMAYEDWAEDVERVSLVRTNLKEMPTAPISHKLSTLILQGNPLDIQLDRDFFNSFPNLKILDLSDTQVRLEPKSLSCLKHLTILLLRNCIHLTRLPLLSELVALMVLDVSGSPIEELPAGVNNLIKLLWLKISRTRVRSLPLLSALVALTVLDVSGCPIAELPSLSELVSLMVLNISGCPITELPSLSELEELAVLDISDCLIVELPDGMNHLTKLARLNLSRTRVKQFPSALLAQLRHLQELSTIGCDFCWIQKPPMQDAALMPPRQDAAPMPPRQDAAPMPPMQDGSTAAFIEDVQKFVHFGVLEIAFASLQVYSQYIRSPQWGHLWSYKFCVGGLYNGKLRDNSIVFIKEFPNDQNWLPFHTSELLLVKCGTVTQLTMPKLCNLKFLNVSYCQNLKHLFQFFVWRNLGNLEEIVIAHCPNLEKVIDTSTGNIGWRRLRKLTLCNLPKLRFMNQGETTSHSMQEIGIWKCSKLEKFPISLWLDHRQRLASPPCLKEIRGDKSWLESLKQSSPNSSEVTFLEKTLIEGPPPEELISRDNGMTDSPSDLASGS
ncbi:Disease resistance protein [Melia azedarach]|uniref:Disease resistance protein n=1 Tax=Melia azedarach TaxID=155640 RepID=A0ACC1Y6I5_MELAZ|nr:Disease resistance protein [Melia azedarach]